MKAVYVAPKKTPMTWQEAHDCMKWALSTHLGHDPSDEVLSLALAKSALETGKWKSIWNDNWGNVKASEKWEGQMYTCIYLNEVLLRDGVRKVIWFMPEGELTDSLANGGKLVGEPMAVPPGHVQTRMRAYANHWDGADQYITFVANGNYKKAWAALLTGNPTAYVHELKVAGYFTADEKVYAKSVNAIYLEMLQKVRGVPDPIPADVDWDAIRRIIPSIQVDWEEYEKYKNAQLQSS